MIDKITSIKHKVLEFMNQEAGKYGNTRMDTKQMGELADIVKDLAEAEYYCSVAEAMGTNKQEGYTPMGERMGYGGGNMGRSGYGGSSMGHSDPMSALRDMFATADPETKSMLRGEIAKLMM